MKKIKQRLYDFFHPPQCQKCNSFKIDIGYWTRGYNEYCKQACGDMGSRCFDCGNIEWDQDADAYKKSLPNWCYMYGDKEAKERAVKMFDKKFDKQSEIVLECQT